MPRNGKSTYLALIMGFAEKWRYERLFMNGQIQTSREYCVRLSLRREPYLLDIRHEKRAFYCVYPDVMMRPQIAEITTEQLEGLLLARNLVRASTSDAEMAASVFLAAPKVELPASLQEAIKATWGTPAPINFTRKRDTAAEKARRELAREERLKSQQERLTRQMKNDYYAAQLEAAELERKLEKRGVSVAAPPKQEKLTEIKIAEYPTRKIRI